MGKREAHVPVGLRLAARFLSSCCYLAALATVLYLVHFGGAVIAYTSGFADGFYGPDGKDPVGLPGWVLMLVAIGSLLFLCAFALALLRVIAWAAQTAGRRWVFPRLPSTLQTDLRRAISRWRRPRWR